MSCSFDELDGHESWREVCYLQDVDPDQHEEVLEQ